VPDHTQRLNPHALQGAPRAEVDSVRAIWAIWYRLAPGRDEENAVELKREIVNGRERRRGTRRSRSRQWISILPKPEVSRIRIAIETWDNCDNHGAAAGRVWLAPLLGAAERTLDSEDRSGPRDGVPLTDRH
jgi:hypothetical protein